MALQISQELADALVTGGMKTSMLTEVGDRLFDTLEIHTTEEYVGFFTTNPKFLEDFWKSEVAWVKKGSLLAHLSNTLDALVEAKGRSAEAKRSLLDTSLENPIDPKTNTSLSKNWNDLYGVPLHPTQKGTHQILGAMWRQFQLRQIRADPVRGLKTLESTHGIEPNRTAKKMGTFRILDEAENPRPKTIQYQIGSNPFLFICALEVMLRTMTKAGTYWVDDPEDDRSSAERTKQPRRLMLDREPIEEHLAQCRAFVLEWSTKQRPPRDATITSQLARIDLRIR